MVRKYKDFEKNVAETVAPQVKEYIMDTIMWQLDGNTDLDGDEYIEQVHKIYIKTLGKLIFE